ncbi:hypothetical protein [Peptoniphilus catoniae]|uniref:hypothetical protein n=1 Tax=Peptoniphilus catoniae TaxID=1660341 RepID=UPI001C58C504|nr:hypothetical protein [Peptoniphilus catoniae]
MSLKIKEFDRVLLKDGREADIMEVLSDEDFIGDVGSGPSDWETIDIKMNDIVKVLSSSVKR